MVAEKVYEKIKQEIEDAMYSVGSTSTTTDFLPEVYIKNIEIEHFPRTMVNKAVQTLKIEIIVKES